MSSEKSHTAGPAALPALRVIALRPALEQTAHRFFLSIFAHVPSVAMGSETCSSLGLDPGPDGSSMRKFPWFARCEGQGRAASLCLTAACLNE